MKRIFTSIALLMFTSVPALAAPPAGVFEETNAAKYKITRDQNYIYVKRPKALFFDNDQQEAFEKIDAFVRRSLLSMDTQMVSDPSGDLAALNGAIHNFQKQLDDLVIAAGTVFNEVKQKGLAPQHPTAFILFGGVEYDSSMLKFMTGGGSIMVGLVMMPIEVHKYRIDTREYVGSETDWDTSWIAIPTVNLGAGVTNGGENPRAGVALVWGPLNSASELKGLTVGPSATIQLFKGINVKMLGVKNFSKPGAINNTVLMVGVEPKSASAGTSGMPKYAAEVHFNLSAMVDLLSLVGPVVNMLPPYTASVP